MEKNIWRDAEISSHPIDLSCLLAKADALIIVPPFVRLDMPHLGAHILQACARQAGFEVKILYAGILLAKEISEATYRAISDSATIFMFGERIFAEVAYGVPFLGKGAEQLLSNLQMSVGTKELHCTIDYDLLKRLAHYVGPWTERLVAAISKIGFPVVGCTTIFEQTASSVAILNHVKQLCPQTVTIIGGSNCAGPMARGIASLNANIDYIFSGESEVVFPAFLADVINGLLPPVQIIESEPCANMDGVPTPDYEDYYLQWKHCLLGGVQSFDQILLPYETSRGCWWGQIHHCTFCGVQNMAFRQKNPGRVIEELSILLAKHPSRRVHNADDIMPHSFFTTLIPRLAEELPALDMFYEQKANMTLQKVYALREAGVTVIQPGIEALSTPLLNAMNKGIQARQNIALMRYARTVRMRLVWNLLHGFPEDRSEYYTHYLTLIPLLHHLNPPKCFGSVNIIRFSPYFKQPDLYGIKNLRPAAVYRDILPDGVDLNNIAYYFDCEFSSVVSEDPSLVKAIDELVQDWIRAWPPISEEMPRLSISEITSDAYLLIDTRNVQGTQQVQVISRQQAAAALVARPVARSAPYKREIEWAIANKICVELDSWYIPLATAEVELLEALEAEQQSSVAWREGSPRETIELVE